MRDVDFMIESRIRSDVVQRSRRTTFRVRRTEHDSVDARLLHRPGAHHTGFEGDVQRASVETPSTDGVCCRAQGEHLGMSGGIAAQFTLVVRAGNDTTLTNDDCTDGNVAVTCRGPRLIECLAHRRFVVHGPHSTCADGMVPTRSVR